MQINKVTRNKQLEMIAIDLSIGNLTYFYKLKRPNKEDLNAIQMIFVLLLSNFATQLQKININSYNDCSHAKWDDMKLFCENNSSKIIKYLKELP